MSGLSQTRIPSLQKKVYSGKVRDSYAVGEDKLLIVASDRISAFDVILGDLIPGKGKVLTAITNFWFKQRTASSRTTSRGLIPNRSFVPKKPTRSAAAPWLR